MLGEGVIFSVLVIINCDILGEELPHWYLSLHCGLGLMDYLIIIVNVSKLCIY